MKKLILSVVCLVTISILSMLLNDWLNVALILSSSGSSSYKTHRLFVDPPQDEIAILGSSRASQNYVPSMLSKKAFNYGVDGSGMYETLFFLRQALKNQKEGPVIVNLDPWGFWGEYKPDFKADYRLALSSDIVRQTLPKDRTCFAERQIGLRFHGSLMKNITQEINTMRAVTKKIDAGATLQILSRKPEEWEVINSKLLPQTFNEDSSWQKEINRIYASTDRPIIWVVSAIAPYWRTLYSGQNKMLDFLNRQKKHPDVYVIDLFATTIDYTEDDFMDPTHLNYKGAKRFTAQLKKELDKLSLLKGAE